MALSSDAFLTSDEEDFAAEATFTTSEEEAPPVRKRPAAHHSRPKKGARKAEIAVPEPSASVGSATASHPDQPANSGVFAYAEWVVKRRLQSNEVQLLSDLPDLVLGSICTGMCTEAVCLEALRRASGATKSLQIAFLCEKSKAKREILARLLPCSLLLEEANDLQEDHVTDVYGKQWDKPSVDWLMGGLVCKCLSDLNPKPKSIVGDGPTGTAVKALLGYLRSLQSELRPRVVTVEEVGGILKKKQCEEDQKSAIQVLVDRMDVLGYTATWQKLCSSSYYLPHHRSRVWIHFLKRKPGSDPKILEATANALQSTSEAIVRFQTTTHESLEAVLEHVGDGAFRHPGSVAQRPVSEATEAAHGEFMEAYSVSAKDVEGMKDLEKWLQPLVSPRARKALLLRLCAHAKKDGWNWHSDTLAATVGQSPAFMTVRKDVFPNLVPSAPLVLLRKGKPSLASGLLCLALQGIQQREVEFLGLSAATDDLQRDLAGNAFTANVCFANVLAVILTLFESG